MVPWDSKRLTKGQRSQNISYILSSLGCPSRIVRVYHMIGGGGCPRDWNQWTLEGNDLSGVYREMSQWYRRIVRSFESWRQTLTHWWRDHPIDTYSVQISLDVYKNVFLYSANLFFLCYLPFCNGERRGFIFGAVLHLDLRQVICIPKV